MNPFSLLGPSVPGNVSDDAYGGPAQRVMNSDFTLTNAIAQANRYNNPTRAARLVAFKTAWLSKAEMLPFRPVVGDENERSAIEWSQDLANEVATALAVSD